MNLFKLFGTVELQGVKESIDNVQNLSQQVEGVAKADNKWNSGMKQTAKTVGTVAAVVGGATTAVVAYTKKTMDFVTQKSAELDVIDKGSQRMGISAEKYQEWDFVLSQNGASIARMDMGMKTLTERMRMGDKAFEQLSVSIYNADGSLRNTGDVMQETIFALADMEDVTMRNALANSLFSRAGHELIPTLNMGSEALMKQVEQANELGIVMSGDLVKSGAEFNDKLNQINREVQGLWMQLAGDLLPVVNEVIDIMRPLMPMLIDIVKNLTPIVKELAPILAKALMTIMTNLAPMVEKFVPILVDLLVELLPPLIKIIEEILPIVIRMLEAIIPLLEPLIDVLLPVIVPILEGVAWVIEKVVAPALLGMIKVLESLFGWVSDVGKNIGETWDKISTWTSDKWGNIVGFLNEKWDGIKTKAEEIWGGVSDYFKGLWDDFLSVGKNMVEGIWEGIVSVGTWIKDKVGGFFKKWVMDPVKKLFGISSPSKVFAEYGRNLSQGLADGIEQTAYLAERAMNSLSGAVTNIAADMVNEYQKMFDRIYELTHSAEQVAFRSLDRQRQAYLDKGLDPEAVDAWYNLEKSEHFTEQFLREQDEIDAQRAREREEREREEARIAEENRRIDDELFELENSRYEVEKKRLDEELETMIANGVEKEKAYKLYNIKLAKLDEERLAEYQESLNKEAKETEQHLTNSEIKMREGGSRLMQGFKAGIDGVIPAIVDTVGSVVMTASQAIAQFGGKSGGGRSAGYSDSTPQDGVSYTKGNLGMHMKTWQAQQLYDINLPKQIDAAVGQEITRRHYELTGERIIQYNPNVNYHIDAYEISPERMGEIVETIQTSLAANYGL